MGAACFLTQGTNLIQVFLHEGSQTGNIESTLQYGQYYLCIMLLGLIPFAVSQVYSSTLRETGQTVVPMNAGIVAVIVNLVLNYILIFGQFSTSKMEIVGAAIAQIVARSLESILVLIWTHKYKDKTKFITYAYRHYRNTQELYQ